MDSMEANKTTISHEQEIGVWTRQSRKGVKCSTVDGDKDRLRKDGLVEEFNEVCSMEKHGKTV
jgi:hypothetical protein